MLLRIALNIFYNKLRLNERVTSYHNSLNKLSINRSKLAKHKNNLDFKHISF